MLMNFLILHILYVEKREILSHWQKIRQINYLVISLNSKTIAFTKFLRKKSEREFLQFPHSAVVGKLELYSHLTEKIFRQINYLVISLISKPFVFTNFFAEKAVLIKPSQFFATSM